MSSHRIEAKKPEFSATVGADTTLQHGHTKTIFFNGDITEEPYGTGQFPAGDKSTIKIIQEGNYGFSVSVYINLDCNINGENVEVELIAEKADDGTNFSTWVTLSETRSEYQNASSTLFDFTTRIADEAYLPVDAKVRFKLKWAGDEPEQWGTACISGGDKLLIVNNSTNDGKVMFSGGY